MTVNIPSRELITFENYLRQMLIVHTLQQEGLLERIDRNINDLIPNRVKVYCFVLLGVKNVVEL